MGMADVILGVAMGAALLSLAAVSVSIAQDVYKSLRSYDSCSFQDSLHEPLNINKLHDC